MKTNPKTTLIGILISVALLGALVAVLLKVATLKEAGEFLAITVPALTGIGFIFARDSKNGGNNSTGAGAAVSLLIASAFMFSCKTVENNVETNTSDSVRVETKYIPRDTTIFLPGDTVMLVQYINCPDLKPIKVNDGKASIEIQIKDSVLTAKCKCDDLEMKVRLYEKVIDSMRNHQQTKTITKIIKVHKTPLFVGILAGFGGASLLLGLILIIYKIVKIFKP